MACKIIMMEIAKSGGIHVSESCLSPSLGWLGPTKISSSTDVDAPQEASYEKIIKERSNDRDSMSEFEFAMSTIKHENMHGDHMLAADELFFKGKLLPLYNPDYTDGSGDHMLAADELFFKGKLLPLYNPDYTDGSSQQVSGCDMRDQANHQILSNHTTSSCALYTANAENSQANTRDLTTPISPKAPKCSMMLREFFGLKKMAKSICACTASGEVATGSSCKSSRSGNKKGKAAKNKQKDSLMLQGNAPLALCKARHLSCASRDVNCITAKARNSASEPLLTCCVSQLGYTVSSVEDHQANPQHIENLEGDNTALSAACTDAFDIAFIQRSNRVSDSLCTQYKDSHEQILLGTSYSENLRDEENQCRRSTGQQSPGRSRRRSLQMNLGRMSLDKSSSGALNYEENACSLGLPRAQSRGLSLRPKGMRLGELSNEEDTCRALTREQSRGSMQMRLAKSTPERILRSPPNYEGSTCRGLAGEQNRGSRRPMQVESGKSSPERMSSRTWRYTENYTCRGLKTDQSRGATRVPMRINIGETSPERSSLASQARYGTSETLEISRTKILERSSSYSPKSLQRKYEQLKAIRQREGWRILERSSSYNSGMHSMRVAPVLNVPIVCMSRSKSSNHGMHTRRKA